MRFERLFGVFACLLTGCISRMRTGPAKPSPPMTPISVTLPSTAPAEGKGRLLLDVAAEDGNATVKEVDQRGSVSLEGYHGEVLASTIKEHVICATPCVVDLPFGGHEFHFIGSNNGEYERESTKVINVTSDIEAYRVSLDDIKREKEGAWLVGKKLEVFGFVFVGAGALVMGLSQTDEHSHKYLPLGIASTAASARLAAVGIVMASSAQGELRPGSITRWTVPPSRSS
jgi:hypothetical protein